MLAALSGNVEVAHALVAEHKADVLVRLRDANTVTGFDAGSTPLHMCMAVVATGHDDMRALLVNSGAGIKAQSKSGL